MGSFKKEHFMERVYTSAQNTIMKENLKMARKME